MNRKTDKNRFFDMLKTQINEYANINQGFGIQPNTDAYGSKPTSRKTRIETFRYMILFGFDWYVIK